MSDVCNNRGSCTVHLDDNSIASAYCDCNMFFSQSSRCSTIDVWWWAAPTAVIVVLLIFFVYRFVKKK